jgi:hypothetical protein
MAKQRDTSLHDLTAGRDLMQRCGLRPQIAMTTPNLEAKRRFARIRVPE